MESTLVMIKPDCVYRKMVGLVISALETRNLNILNMIQKVLTKEEAIELYKVHRGKWHFERNINHVTSGPVVLLEVEGQEAVRLCREFVEHFREANQDVVARPRNLVHASDAPDSAVEELSAVGFKSQQYSIAV